MDYELIPGNSFLHQEGTQCLQTCACAKNQLTLKEHDISETRLTFHLSERQSDRHRNRTEIQTDLSTTV